MTFYEKIHRFFEPIKSNTWVYVRGFFVAVLWGINGIVHVIFLEKFTYYLLQKPDTFGSILILYGLFLCSYELINFLLREWGWVEIEGTTQAYVSKKYLSKFIKLDNNYTESLGTGKLISIINDGIWHWGILIWEVIQESMRLIITFAFTIFMIVRINPLYAIIFGILFVIFFSLSKYFNTRMFIGRHTRYMNRLDISRNVVKVLMSKNELLQNNSIEKENESIGGYYKKDIQINQDMGILRTFLTRNSGFGLALFILATYYFLGFGFLEGTVELSVIVGLSGALIVMQRVIYDALLFYIDFTKQFIKVSTLWEVFDNAPEIEGYERGSSFTSKSQDIILNSITYGYNESRVFSDFSLTIEKGKKTALVGASGGGKTTLMKLIAGYLHPESGTLSVMGNILSETALKTYYPHIGYLTQDPSVFDGSIRDNLISAVSNGSVISTESSGSVTTRHPAQKDGGIEQDFSIPLRSSRNDRSPEPQVLEQKLIQALHLAQCDFVFDMQHGLDTEIGERGVRLSGGQKQRLAIAKIFLKDPEIILLDEPTSALDSFSEEQITKALDELFRDRTVIVIAHRLQTVKKADEIIVIEGGKVVERGSHKTLVAKGGIYSRMLELQSGF